MSRIGKAIEEASIPERFHKRLPRSVGTRIVLTGRHTYVSPDEVAHFLRTSVGSLKRMVKDKLFPAPFHIGRNTFWMLSDVVDAVLEMEYRGRFGLMVPDPTPVAATVPAELQEVSSVWQEYQPKREPVVYFLLSEGKVVYIGSTLCIARRLPAHRGKGHDRAVYFHVEESRMLAVEAEMIRRFQPPLNFAANPARERRRKPVGATSAGTE